MISSNSIFNFTNFCVIVSFLAKLRTLGILLSTAIRAVVVARLIILGILFLTSFIFALKAVVVAKFVMLCISFLTLFIYALRVILVAKLVISGILSSIFLILALYTSFLTTSVFNVSLSLLKSTGTGANLSKSNLCILLFKLLKLVGTFLIYQDLVYLH